MFADNILLLSSSLATDLPAVKQALEEFRNMTGLRVNYFKSEVLPMQEAKPRLWFDTSPFSIAPDHLKYLGVLIGKTPASTYTLNYPPLIAKIVGELEAWKDLPLSLLGRVHLFKMSSFPKLLYPMQTLMLLLKLANITKLNRALGNFLWRSKCTRIALHKLWLRVA